MKAKKILTLLLCVILCISSLPASATVSASKTSKTIVLNKTKLTMTVGQKKTVRIKNQPKHAKITVKVKNKKIISATRKGKKIVFKAKKAGSTKVIVTFRYKKNKKTVTKKRTCKITVEAAETPSGTGAAIPATTPPASVTSPAATQAVATPTPVVTEPPIATESPVKTPSPEEQIRLQNIQEGYYPVTEVLAAAGYTSIAENVYTTSGSKKSITLVFDYKAETCTKNYYTFSLTDAVITDDITDAYYVKKETLEEILNQDLDFEADAFRFSTPASLSSISWFELSPLIAHAGGAVREDVYNSYYTNSLDALIQNYDLGHRIFEFDFNLTSDNNLACIHNWKQFGYCDGTVLSSEEWKNFKTFGKPVTEGRYTTMLIGDLLDEMMVNKDIYVVTDTKETGEAAKTEFQIIYEEAMKRDPELLNRIIPQIYNFKMYDYVK